MFTVFAFGWLILPLLVFGLDGTLDPATLALYPLRTRPLAVGLLAASATGAWPLANVIGLLGVTVGLARGALGLLVAVVAVLLQVLFCITLARFVTTGMAGMLRSRRGKDFAAFLIIPIFALYETFAQVVPRLAAEGKITARTFAGIDRWLRWLPPGLAAHAIQDASDGHAGAALLRLALLAAVILVLGRSGSGPSAGPWSPWTPAPSRPLCAARRCRSPGPASAARWPPGSCSTSAATRPRSSAGASSAWSCWPRRSAPSGRPPTMSGYHQRAPGGRHAERFQANTFGLTGPAFGLEASALSGLRALRAYFTGRDVALAVIAVPLSRCCPSASPRSPGIRGTGSWAWPSTCAPSARRWG